MSDDEFGDFDIELNEETIRALQDTEDRFTLTTASQAQAQHTQPKPVASSFAPPTAVRRPAVAPAQRSYVDFDDTPDISIGLDGSYAVQPASTSTTRGAGPSGSNVRKPVVTQRSVPRTTHHVASGPSRQTTARGAVRPASKPIARPMPTVMTNTAGAASRNLPSFVDDAENSMDVDGGNSLVDPHTGPSAALVAKLQAQVQELSILKEASRKQLEEMQNAQFVRDGEIATLRRTMEKQSASHSEALNKLRAEKMDAEKKRAAIEAEMAAEVDRLKTRFSFKQQEYETAALRGPGAPPSTGRRGKRVQSSQQPTPGPSRFQPSQGIGRGALHSFAAGSQTPLMSQRITGKLSASKIEPIPFPGFQDAFGQRDRPARKDKGKGRAVISDSPIQEARLRTIPDTRFSDPFAEPAPLEETQQLGTLETDPGAPPNDTVDEGLEAPQDLPSFEWSNELFRLIFTCAAPSFPTRPTLAIQDILSVSFSVDHVVNSEDRIKHWTAYQSACAELLSLFSHVGEAQDIDTVLDPGENQNYQRLVRGIGSSLLIMLDALLEGDAKQYGALYSALYLISSLVLILPSFNEFFLTSSAPRSLASMLAVVLRDYKPEKGQTMWELEPSMSKMSRKDQLGACALSLVEVLVWGATDASCSSLSIFVNATNALSQLVDPEQPFWLIRRAVRLLLLFSIRSAIAPSLFPSNVDMELDPSIDDGSTYEHLCGYLADTNSFKKSASRLDLPASCVPSFQDVWEFLGLTNTFLIELGVSRGSGLRLLEKYTFLVPSMILCLAEVSNWLWEEDAFARAPSGDHEALTAVLVTGLQLLHCLFYGAGHQPGAEIPEYADLPHILTTAANGPQPIFSALDHTYIVTMARLGYADVPDWLGADRVRVVDDVAELARELLELFVGGPEGDLIIEAYVPQSQERSQRPGASVTEAGLPKEVNVVEDDEGETTEEESSDGHGEMDEG